MFRPVDLIFEPGLFANRSRRASRQRWVDGAFVRFRDGVPQQIGGWIDFATTGATMTGVPRHARSWTSRSQLGRYGFVGCHDAAYLLDGSLLSDITPDDFEAGRPAATLSAGFGVGAFGVGTYGTPRTGSSYFEAGMWTSDMFGDVLIACSNHNGRIYDFDLLGGATKLEVLENAPIARAICVSDERHVVAFGADGVPGRVSWSDRENRTEWTPTATNRAGSYDLAVSSPFQCGHRVRGNVVGWTASDVVLLFPLNNSLVYGYEVLSADTGAAGPAAVVVATAPEGEVAFWMSDDDFYMFDGVVRRLESELYDYVFDDINLDQASQFMAAHVSEHAEVWFFYCSAGSTYNDRAVIYDYQRNTWSKAPIGRTAWVDARVFDYPLAFDSTGNAYWHENGDDAAGSVMPSFVTCHPLMVGRGEQFAEISTFWPDMAPASKQCELTVIGRDRPDGPALTFGPYPFVPASQKIDLNVAAREVQFRIDGKAGFWEVGVPQIAMQGGSLR